MAYHSPSRSYRSADGGTVTEGPGYRSYEYSSPDGGEYRRESHREMGGGEEYEYESRTTTASPGRSALLASYPSHSPRGSLYQASHSAYLPPPPPSSMDMGRLSPRSPFFPGSTGTRMGHGFDYTETDRLHRDVEAQVARIKADAEREVMHARMEAEDALRRSASPGGTRYSPSYRPPAYSSPPRAAVSSSDVYHSPSRYSGGYVSPSRHALPLGGDVEEYEEYTHTVTTTYS